MTRKELFALLTEKGVDYNEVGGKVNVNGSVDLSSKDLTQFPVKFGIVKGSFNCSNNQLTTLEGAPREVGGNFNCSSNQLTTLQGAPNKVGGVFICSRNPGNFTQQDIDKAMKGQAERVELAIRSLLADK